MDKQEVIKQLRDLNLPKDEYYVLSGASLVLRGIREKCSDIDLCIPEELFSSVKDKRKMTSDKIKSLVSMWKKETNLILKTLILF